VKNDLGLPAITPENIQQIDRILGEAIDFLDLPMDESEWTGDHHQRFIAEARRRCEEVGLMDHFDMLVLALALEGIENGEEQA